MVLGLHKCAVNRSNGDVPSIAWVVDVGHPIALPWIVAVAEVNLRPAALEIPAGVVVADGVMIGIGLRGFDFGVHATCYAKRGHVF